MAAMALLAAACGAELDVSIDRDPTTTVVASKPDALAGIDAHVEQLVSNAAIPGLAWGVASDGQVAASGAAGWADVADSRPATAESAYSLGSVSKPVLGIVVMQLVEDGLLDLDANIDEYLDFSVDNPLVDGEVITLRSLMTHRSGLIDDQVTYAESYSYDGDSPIVLKDFLIAYFTPEGDLYSAVDNFGPVQPGESFSYSNIGAGLLGHIVESVTGRSLNDYARDELFDPLGMTNTGWRLRDFDDLDRVATPYSSDTSGYKAIGHVGFPTWPDGGLRSSATDIARLLAAVSAGGSLDGTEILTAASVSAMLDGELFWATQGDFSVHGGSDPGAQSMIVLHRPSGVAVTVMTNSDQRAADDAMMDVVEVLLAAYHIDFVLQDDGNDQSVGNDAQSVLDAAMVGVPGGVTVVVNDGDDPPMILSSGEDGIADEPIPMPGVTTAALAVLVLHLVEEGTLEMTTPVAELLGDHELSGAIPPDVRIYHLLSHTSGLALHQQNMGAEATVSELLASVDLSATAFEPGTRFDYSTTNNLLAGVAIEARTGSSLEELLQAQVIGPAGLENTELIRVATDSVVDGYLPGAADEPVAASDYGPGMSLAGTLAMPASDVVLFQQALGRGLLLPSPASAELMQTPVTGELYGLGVQDLTALVGPGVFGLPGDSPGYRSFTMHTADGSVAVAIIANSEFVDVQALAEELLR